MKLVAFKTPFWTLISGTRYSFINAGRTANGPHVSATIAMATEAGVKADIVRAVQEVNERPTLVKNLAIDKVTAYTVAPYRSR